MKLSKGTKSESVRNQAAVFVRANKNQRQFVWILYSCHRTRLGSNGISMHPSVPTMLMSINQLALCMECHMHSPDNNITDVSTRYKITPQPLTFFRSDFHSHLLFLTCTILFPEHLVHKQ